MKFFSRKENREPTPQEEKKTKKKLEQSVVASKRALESIIGQHSRLKPQSQIKAFLNWHQSTSEEIRHKIFSSGEFSEKIISLAELARFTPENVIMWEIHHEVIDAETTGPNKKKKEVAYHFDQAFSTFESIFNQESALNMDGKIQSLIAWWRTWGDVIDNYDFRASYSFPLTLERLIEFHHRAITLRPEDQELLEFIYQKLRLWHAGVLRPVTYWR